MSALRQLFLKTDNENMFELCFKENSLVGLLYAEDVCQSLFFG